MYQLARPLYVPFAEERMASHNSDHSVGSEANACGCKDLPRIQVLKAEIIAEVHAPLKATI